MLTPACAEFDSSSERCGPQEDKGHSGTWKRYPLAVGATVLCVLPCITLPYIIGLIRAPNGARCGAQQTQRAEFTRGRDGGCYLSPVLSSLLVFFFLSLWRKTDKLTHLRLRGFCLHFLLILYNTMVIGRSGRVCIWCNKLPPPLSHPTPPLHLPSPHPVESSLKDLLLMS